MAYDAEAKVGCGTHNYEIEADVRQCGINKESFLPSGVEMQKFNKEYAERVIEEFCYDKKKTWTVDPEHPEPETDKFVQFPGEKDDTFPSMDYRYGEDKSDEVIGIFVSFFDGGEGKGCAEPKKFNIGDDRARCKKLLTQILADPEPCPGGTDGSVRELGAEHGCPVYQMWQWKTTG